MTEYLFDNAAPEVARRIDALASLYDPITARHLEARGVADGWHCLEVGGGSGSVAAWLARRVGPTAGSSSRTSTRGIWRRCRGGLANVEVQRHDVTADSLEDGAFDLVHARLVLGHVPARREALGRMAAALPAGRVAGGRGFRPALRRPDLGHRGRAFAALYAKMQDALIRLLESRGADPEWGRQLPAALRTVGMWDVGAEGRIALAPGRSPSAGLYRANIEQVRAEAVRAGLIADEEVDELLDGLDDSNIAGSTRVMISAWGRRPPGGTRWRRMLHPRCWYASTGTAKDRLIRRIIGSSNSWRSARRSRGGCMLTVLR